MANRFQSVRGFNDVLPVDSAAWQQLYRIAGEVFAAYGYGEIKLPLLEHTAPFKRSIGRSEAHTSELQSLMSSSYAAFCFKKKTTHPDCLTLESRSDTILLSASCRNPHHICSAGL